jgi:hypothetical protein
VFSSPEAFISFSQPVRNLSIDTPSMTIAAWQTLGEMANADARRRQQIEFASQYRSPFAAVLFD